MRTVEIPDADRRELLRRARSKGAPARVVEPARIVLLAGEGMAGKRIAARVGCAEPTVVSWRRRYAESGLAGLEDLPRPGSLSPLPEALRDQLLELTLTKPPTSYGATHWSSRLLAAALAAEGTPISHATTARIWHRFGVQPWRSEAFKFSTDPELEGKIRDVVGLYLHPPGEGRGALRRRKASAPGAGADRAGPADPAGIGRAADPRLHPARHHHAVLLTEWPLP